MERKSDLPERVVIGQDDQSEIHVQPIIQTGSYSLDVRTWRRSPNGFAPSRAGLVLTTSDLEAMHRGIVELLRTSDGGQTVARVVWDDDHGRRLRAEIEPFGTRHVVRLGFWQRVRDTWRPADDGLVLAADRLELLRDALDAFRLWMAAGEQEKLQAQAAEQHLPSIAHWPSPGADWLTVEADRIAFHPRGVRITFSIETENVRHTLLIRQWRREDSLWLPEPVFLSLTIAEIDNLLSCLLRLTRAGSQEESRREDVVCPNEAVLRISITQETPAFLQIEHALAPQNGEAPSFQPPLCLPAEYLSRFGRALAQGWSLLASRLSEEEREELIAHFPSQSGVEAEMASSGDMEVLHEAPTEETTLPNRTESHPANDPYTGGGHSAEPEMEAGERQRAPFLHTKLPPAVEPADLVTDSANGTPGQDTMDEERQERMVEAPLFIPLGQIQVEHHSVSLSLQGFRHQPRLALRWEGHSLDLPAGHLEELLSGLRDLYYDALRGRRGRELTIGEHPEITVGVHTRGSQLCFEFQQTAVNGETSLSLPASEVPALLDVARAALPRTEGE